MSTAPEFRYTLDEAYLDTVYARTVAALPRWPRIWRFALQPMLETVLLWLCASLKLEDEVLGLFVVLLLVPPGIVFQILKARKDRRERYYGTPLEDALVRVRFAEEGLEIEAAGEIDRQPWSSLVQARVFEDGILLRSTEKEGRWLPDAAIVAGTVAQARELLRANVVDFAVVPGREREN